MADVYPGGVRIADEAYDGLPSQVPPFVSVPVIASPNNVIVRGAGDERRAISLDQAVTVTPQSTSANNKSGDLSSVDGPVVSSLAISGTPSDPAQTIHIGPTQNHNRNVEGGSFSPLSANVINTTQNSTVNQVFGTGLPKNVNV